MEVGKTLEGVCTDDTRNLVVLLVSGIVLPLCDNGLDVTDGGTVARAEHRAPVGGSIAVRVAVETVAPPPATGSNVLVPL